MISADSLPVGTIREAYAYCDRLARSRARHFYPAFRFLPRPRRLAMSAFYAFCALSDDISDEPGQSSEARRERLALWRRDLRDAFEARRTDMPVFRALLDAARRFDLPRQPFDDLLAGIEMDLEPRRYATFADLEIYCRRVASSVGRVSVRIFGCRHPGADLYADNLGIAFQLTNILRDLSEDLQRDRVYLPQEDLERFGCSEADLSKGNHIACFPELMRFQYQRARTFFRAADPALVGDQSRRLFVAEIMKAIYAQLLEEIRRRDFRVMDGRIQLPWWRKSAALLRGLAFPLRNSTDRT